ncbi:MAG: penicillin acylase family protein [Anaerolineales bacterium]|nr:penicillin acylase family protein [Anaerolineales bacterium]
MRTRRMRWGYLFGIGFIILILIVLISAAILIRRPFPETNGTIKLTGLDAPVEVYRDEHGIPHIYASTTHDLFMAQGFVHAQDRFWQMEFSRRIGNGTLSEIMGPATLDSDRFIRTLGWHRTAQMEIEQLGPEVLAALEAYAQGVNAYLASEGPAYGLEFEILGLTGVDFEPEPWTPLNTLTWGKVMAWDLGGNRSVELAYAHLIARLGMQAYEELVVPYGEDKPVIVTELPSEISMAAIPEVATHQFLFGEGDDLGSNNWVLSGSRTESGFPILANDTHLGIQLPSIWYENGIHCTPVGPECPYNVVGFTFPSVPGVIIGHNDRIAWGVTNVGPDVQDLFIERTNPQNPDQYEVNGRWEDMQIIEEQIFIAGEEEPEIVRVRVTRHGPIINDIAGGTNEEWSFGWQPLALSWTALEPGTIWESVLMINRAQDWDSFREALSFWDVPSQNFVYADVEGNIGYQTPGRIPIRASGDGSLPVPGWTGAYDWVDFIPFEELPRSFNPEKGYLVTANNAVVDGSYRYFISKDWAPGYRAKRISELIEAQEILSVADIQRIHADSMPLYAQEVLPALLALEPESAEAARALDLLRAWDGVADRDSSAAAIFEALRVHMVDRIFADELGEDLLDRMRGKVMDAIPTILQDENSHWFDDIYTEQVEGQETMLLLALEDALADLEDRLGDSMEEWRWGDLHTATFKDLGLGQSGIVPIEWLFNRGPVEADGTGGAPNATGYSLADPYEVTSLPSQRMIVDLQYFENSLTMHTTGQSGHTFHKHYADFIDPWRNIEYHPMLWTRGQVEAAAADHMTLIP